MLTRNYDSLTTGFMTILPPDGFAPVESDWLGGMPGVVKDHNGLLKIMDEYSPIVFSTFGNSSNTDNLSQMQTSSGKTFSPILLAGSNNAEESYNDYSLNILKDLTVVGYRSAGIAYTSEGCVYTTVKTFLNNTEKDITVNELGLSQHYGTSFDVLLYRRKLDTPITLKAKGGTATFSLVIDIPYANKP